MSGPADAAELETWLTQHDIGTVVVGSSDLNAAWIGKRLAAGEFLAACRGDGVAFSDVFFVITRDGENVVEPAGGAAYPGYFPRKEQGYPDVFLRCDLATPRVLSWQDRTAALLGDFVLPDGSPVPIAPRGLLAAQVRRAHELGLDPQFAAEFEFYLLEGGAAGMGRQDRDLQPISSRPYTYNVVRAGVDETLLAGFRDALTRAGVPVEGLNPETGPGQYEINVHYDSALPAADAAFLYKNVIKELAQRRGLLASFMAKPATNWAGSSCHLHQSLRDLGSGEPIFPSGAELTDLSDTARHYIGGLLATMADFMALFAPTTNAYKRLAPYSWAGTTVTWGGDNRSVSCRVVGHAPTSRRVEHRVCGADVNPYLAMAACLAGGLYGVVERIEPPEPYIGDAYAEAKAELLPRTLTAALDRFDGSLLARRLLGDDFVNYYLAMRRWETEQQDNHVSGWEVAHYLETA